MLVIENLKQGTNILWDYYNAFLSLMRLTFLLACYI